MTKHTVYIDESGNTGANFSDIAQTILVLIAVGIPHDSMSNILLRLDEIKSEFGYSVDHEIHAKNIANRNRERLCQAVLNLLIEHDFSLFVSVSEKKYVLATIIYDNFFDPVYNDHCDATWTHPSPVKPLRADFIYNCLSDDAWQACGRAFRNGDQMQRAYELVLNDIKNKTCDIDLYPILQGAKAHINELAMTFASTAKPDRNIGVPSGVRNSPNLIAFCGLTNKIEQYYSARGHKVTITFDHSRQFNAWFRHMFEHLRDARRIQIEMPGEIPLQLGYDSLTQFDADRSRQNSFLQLSDLLATSFMDSLSKAYRGDTLSVDEALLLFFLMEYRDNFRERYSDFLVSSSFVRRIDFSIRSTADVHLNLRLNND